LLIDTMNTDLSDQVFVKKQILLMLKTSEISDPTALYVLGQKSRELQAFTTDRGLLSKAMEAFQPEQSAKLRMATTPTPTTVSGGKLGDPTIAMTRQSFDQIRAFANRDRALATMDAFEDLGKYLTRVPGRKSIIWVSNAFPFMSLRSEADRVRVLDRADVTIYAVDARGLTGPFGPPSYQDTVNWVAAETGGRAFYNRNDLDAAIREAIMDGEVTYTLGFYSHRDKPDGNFHALKVEVDRPGLDVRHRAGYFDVDTKPSQVDSSVLLRRAANAPEDVSGIGLIAAIARMGKHFQVAAQVDFKDLRLDSEDGKWNGSAELAFASQTADGRTLDLVSKKLTFDMTNEVYQARQREGFVLEQMIPVRDGTAKIRVVIVDRSGAAGSVSITPPKP
jgi:VWFA-related protein